MWQSAARRRGGRFAPTPGLARRRDRFWLGNSVLNPATLVFMGFVLGWHWAALRLVLGVLMVFGLGYLVNRLVTPQEAAAADGQLARLAALQEQERGNPFVRWLDLFARMAACLIPNISS